MVTPEAVWERAVELAPDGATHLSLKYALWAAVLSPQKDLHRNGKLALSLKPWSDKPLPFEDPERLWKYLRKHGDGYVSRSDAKNVWLIDFNIKTLERLFGTKPETWEEWQEWRWKLSTTVRGISFKVASFAALLIWPFDSPLVPVDTHVLQRLGLEFFRSKISAKNRRAYRRYQTIEWLVYQEWITNGQLLPIALWHWYKWSEYRALKGLEGEGVQSHAALSPWRE